MNLNTSIPFAKNHHLSGFCNIQAKIELVASALKNDMNYEEIKLIFQRARIPIPQILIPQVDFTTIDLYRVRKASEFRENPYLTSSHSIPPTDKVSTQRANVAMHPVLYCALLPQTAIKEVGIEEGEIIYLSYWKVKPGIKLSLVNLFLSETDLPCSWHNAVFNLNSQLEKLLANYEKESVNGFKNYLKIISSWFLKKNDYLLSSYLGHNILYDTLINNSYRHDGIIYPSVADELEGVNVAFSPNVIVNLEITRVQKGMFLGIVPGGIEIEIHEEFVPS